MSASSSAAAVARRRLRPLAPAVGVAPTSSCTLTVPLTVSAGFGVAGGVSKAPAAAAFAPWARRPIPHSRHARADPKIGLPDTRNRALQGYFDQLGWGSRVRSDTEKRPTPRRQIIVERHAHRPCPAHGANRFSLSRWSALFDLSTETAWGVTPSERLVHLSFRWRVPRHHADSILLHRTYRHGARRVLLDITPSGGQVAKL